MEELRALVDVISKNKVKKIELVGSEPQSSSNYQKLYDQISTGRLETDSQGEVFFSQIVKIGPIISVD